MFGSDLDSAQLLQALYETPKHYIWYLLLYF